MKMKMTPFRLFLLGMYVVTGNTGFLTWALLLIILC